MRRPFRTLLLHLTTSKSHVQALSPLQMVKIKRFGWVYLDA